MRRVGGAARLPPELYGYRSTGWTVAVLERHFAAELAAPVSGATLRRTLHRLGYRWKRPRYVLARREVFGALNPFAGTRLAMPARRNGGPEFRAYLRWLRARYKRWDLLLVLDRGSCHTAKATLALAAALRITLAWLPTACPELNPVEALWRDAKQRVSANRAHADMDAHAADFVAHVVGHTDHTALRLCGARSGNFWLTT